MTDNRSSDDSKAFHEAGHLVAGVALGLVVEKVEMMARDGGDGAHVTWEKLDFTAPQTPDSIRDWCFMIIAGHESEELFCPGNDNYSSDYWDRGCLTKAFRTVSQEAEAALHEDWRANVRSCLKAPQVRKAIYAVAECLLAHPGGFASAQANDVVRTILQKSGVQRSDFA